MHTVFALLCFVVVIHWLIFPYPSGLLHWHCGNLTIAPVPAKQPWWIWINTSCEFIMNDCITTTKKSTIKPCAYFLGYAVYITPYSSFICHDGPTISHRMLNVNVFLWRYIYTVWNVALLPVHRRFMLCNHGGSNWSLPNYSEQDIIYILLCVLPDIWATFF